MPFKIQDKVKFKYNGKIVTGLVEDPIPDADGTINIDGVRVPVSDVTKCKLSESIVSVLEGLTKNIVVTPRSKNLIDIKKQMIELAVEHHKKNADDLEVFTDRKSQDLMVLDKGHNTESQLYVMYSIKDKLITILSE